MKTSFISTSTLSQSTRYQITRMQADLVKAEKEVVTQRVADTGIHLGGRTGQAVALERDVARLKGIIDTNGLAAARMTSTQDGLKSLSDIASNLLSTLTAAAGGSVEGTIVRTEALGSIASMTSILNASLNGEYLFAGVNTDVKPIAEFGATGSPARAAMENAFTTHFGFSHTDPQAAGISATDLSDFLTNVLEPQFMGSDWSTNWSGASDQTIVSRITLNDTENTSISANENGVKRMALAAAAVGVFFEGAISTGARAAVAKYSASVMGQATADLAQAQARLGVVEQRVISAKERLSMQVDVFKGTLNDLVGIDPYEASSRVSNLLTQIETSYTLTSRIRQLSLVRFLP